MLVFRLEIHLVVLPLVTQFLSLLRCPVVLRGPLLDTKALPLRHLCLFGYVQFKVLFEIPAPESVPISAIPYLPYQLPPLKPDFVSDFCFSSVHR